MSGGILHALAAAPAADVDEDLDFDANYSDETLAPAFGNEEEQAALDPDAVTDNRRTEKVAYKPSIKYLEAFTGLTIVIAFAITPHILAFAISNERLAIWAGSYASVIVSCLLILTVPRGMRRSVKNKSNATKKMVIMTLVTVISCGVSWIVATH